MKSKFASTYMLERRPPSGTETKLLPEERRIGKGYRDKGTARKPHLDASPPWQDIASAVAKQERLMKEAVNDIPQAENFEELKSNFWKAINARNHLDKLTNTGRGRRTESSSEETRIVKKDQ
jgi:hypothetical protein